MPHHPALELAEQIRARVPTRAGLDQLKLQKLCFYAYGAALGLGAEGLGEIEFVAWEHGPVNRAIWNEFKGHRASPLPPLESARTDYASPAAQTVIDDVVEVYGRMSSWAIRCESHLEEPWLRARRKGRNAVIPQDELRAHFARKFARGCVTLPAHLSGARSAAVDGIPEARFESLHELAQTMRLRSA